jgi:hypothetical protein
MKRELHHTTRTATRQIRKCDLPAKVLDDSPGDREPEAGALGFRRDEGLE